MRILVACEFSGVVRDAFRAKGLDAWSCDLLPCETASDHHLQCDVRGVLADGWDLMICHPPCTHLAVSGARWFKEKRAQRQLFSEQTPQEDAIDFAALLFAAPIEHIALENPVGLLSTRIRKPDQIIQPFHYGHTEMKTTCLWLKNLPLLRPTHVVDPNAIQKLRIRDVARGPGRWRIRSRTFTGIAAAMADQWSGVACAVR